EHLNKTSIERSEKPQLIYATHHFVSYFLFLITLGCGLSALSSWCGSWLQNPYKVKVKRLRLPSTGFIRLIKHERSEYRNLRVFSEDERI
ncbi:MAG: hypothetical protein JXM68_08225, partial [Sedimentisphaerales bacterium]|nr:hypothetical protein [Sedimentisphaerales bacterium]